MSDILSDDELTGNALHVDSDEEAAPRNTVEENGLDDDEDDDDLFGDGGDDDEGEQPAPAKLLDDEDLDSGDDEGRNDRAPETQDAIEEGVQETLNFMDADIARHAVPEPSDGELYLLKVPQFLSIEPTVFNPKNFQVPTTDHHSKSTPSEHFSPYETAMTTIRWRRSPSDPSKLQSNARVLRWSDGSLTLQLASRPLEQYDIGATMLAPPQIKPRKPTPTSLNQKPKTDPKQGYTYLAAPYQEAQVMRVTNRLTTALSVTPTASSKDDALQILQSALAKAAHRTRDDRDQAISFIDVNEDPELKRAREEANFKQQQKQLRAKEKVELRERERASRRAGGAPGRSAGYGLSLAGLEDEEGGRRGGPKKQRAKTGLRRDWSSDEDYGIRGKTREDEYDDEDDFIAASDEEPELVDDDEDPDEGILASPPRRARDHSSPKRNRRGDADEDEDDDEEVVVSRSKRRRVVDDDDDDDE
ncbi:Leo1-like protein-domain-containing protein [Dendryphion nanum]|uniref:Leo1-like protein-domain-containing protein n=1 Tax=Dendryphion nanum TaxID=256645 RepID=A0A9P9E4N0_9PLEO|nr:Leo1-like protein-domain-containing protein [Dendryphion nanum]